MSHNVGKIKFILLITILKENVMNWELKYD